MSKKTKKTPTPTDEPQHWLVEIPIAGKMTIEVVAEDRKAAIAAAWAKIDESDSPDAVGELEWEYHEAITSGNVCHASTNNVSAYEID